MGGGLPRRPMKIIYIVHLERDQQTSHYIGITDEERYKRRMHEHQTDKRQPKIYEQLKKGAVMRTAILAHRADRQLERWFQGASEELLKAEICPHCKQLELELK